MKTLSVKSLGLGEIKQRNTNRGNVSDYSIFLKEQEKLNSKYGNKITYVDGIKFASKKEANHYSELKIRVKANEIFNLKRQVPFVLLDEFKSYYPHSRKIPCIRYIADFTYDEQLADGSVRHVVCDVKGMRTAVYTLKKKMFLQRYPELCFLEV